MARTGRPKADLALTDQEREQLLRNMARQLAGAQIPGGCDECDAYQTMEEDPDLPNAFHVRVHHDDWCPFLARMEERR
jgi:hypothetical protein